MSSSRHSDKLLRRISSSPTGRMILRKSDCLHSHLDAKIFSRFLLRRKKYSFRSYRVLSRWSISQSMKISGCHPSSPWHVEFQWLARMSEGFSRQWSSEKRESSSLSIQNMESKISSQCSKIHRSMNGNEWKKIAENDLSHFLSRLSQKI